jgi:hypothetical protein
MRTLFLFCLTLLEVTGNESPSGGLPHMVPAGVERGAADHFFSTNFNQGNL